MVVQCDFSAVEETFFSWSADLCYKAGDNALAWRRERTLSRLGTADGTRYISVSLLAAA